MLFQIVIDISKTITNLLNIKISKNFSLVMRDTPGVKLILLQICFEKFRKKLGEKDENDRKLYFTNKLYSKH